MKKITLSLLLLFLLTGAFLPESQAANPKEEKPEMIRMLYNNPGLLDDLAVGLWCWPVPVDFNHDGKMDLILSTECVPYNGTYRFASKGINASQSGFGTAQLSSTPVKNQFMPVFSKGERISGGEINVEPSYVNGKLRVLRPAQEFPDFAQTGLQKPVKLPLKANPHPNDVRGNMWKYVDFDGDGKLDLAAGTDDWKPYGWANAWDENGNWKNDQSHGNIYIYRNKGTNDQPIYEDPFRLKLACGKDLLTYGWPSPNFVDFDGDGDLDILCGEFIEHFNYFENIGTRTEPKYAPAVFITLEDGSLAHDVMCMITPLVYDWTGDGLPDIICGNEDGRVCLYENTGKFRSVVKSLTAIKTPIFKAPLYFQQEAHELKAGSLCTPCCVDFDGDGVTDIVCGTSAGNILFFKNLGKPGDEFPKWARPQYIKAGEKVIHIIAGPSGSIQGPIERKYGYTTLTVADWDNDGLPDIMTSSVLGKVVWFKNIGSKTDPKFAPEQAVEVEWNGKQPELAWGWMKPEGKKLLTQWRTTPVMFDWNNDGLIDLCMLDHEGYFVFYQRYKDASGALKLKHPEKIFLTEKGDPLRLTSGKEGGSGRRKICLADWDHDGLTDIIVNSINADVFKQIKTENGKSTFRFLGKVSSTRLAGHTTSPTVADFNKDGFLDLVVGAEDGRFYYLRNPLSK